MKRRLLFWILCLPLMIVVAAPMRAADQPTSSDDMPAILASLDAGNARVLDDRTAMAIRGQNSLLDYDYVLVKILGVNSLDYGPGIQWTWNPLGFRYGANGGPGWSHAGVTPADAMDGLFMLHDSAYASGGDLLSADRALLAGLLSLATAYHSYWGWIYVPETRPTGLTVDSVKVSGLSLIGARFSLWWKPMPYTEYARRQALAGTGLTLFGRSLLSSIGLQ